MKLSPAIVAHCDRAGIDPDRAEAVANLCFPDTARIIPLFDGPDCGACGLCGALVIWSARYTHSVWHAAVIQSLRP